MTLGEFDNLKVGDIIEFKIRSSDANLYYEPLTIISLTKNQINFDREYVMTRSYTVNIIRSRIAYYNNLPIDLFKSKVIHNDS